MTDYAEQSNRYWDFISSLTPAEAEQSVKDLFRASFEFMSPYLDEIHYVSANIIFMNYVCGISQKCIGNFYGLSQYGVSKQIKSAKRKIKFVVIRPESNPLYIRQDLLKLINHNNVETVVLYYQIKMHSIVAKVIGNITEGAVRSRLMCSLKELNRIMECSNVDEFKVYLKDTLVSDIPEVIDSDYFELCKNNASRYLTYLNEVVSVNSYSDHQYALRNKNKSTSEYN